jgi:hypothetical protein
MARFSISASTLLAVSMTRSNTPVLTQVALGDGKTTTGEGSATQREFVEVSQNIGPGADPTSQLLLKRELEGDTRKFRPRVTKDYITAGVNLVEFERVLLEAKEVTVQAMKAPPAESKVNSKLRASSGTAAVAEDIFNELKRAQGGGYRTEDISRYQVTLRRLPAGEAPAWTGEVTGASQFHALNQVDVLIGGKSLFVFDKQNRLLAQATLAFNVADHFGFGFGGAESDAPCLESGNLLFVFDQGVLMALELPSGTIKWRLPTVGVTRVIPDGRGSIYVNTTSASADSIKYSEQISMSDKARPLVLKVNADTGKILWQVESRGGVAHCENKMLFTREAREGSLSLGQTTEHFRIYRLQPGSGKDVFEYYHKGFPQSADFRKTRIALSFDHEVKVLKFMAL